MRLCALGKKAKISNKNDDESDGRGEISLLVAHSPEEIPTLLHIHRSPELLEHTNRT